MKKTLFPGLMMSMILFLMSYVVTICINGSSEVFINKAYNIESCVPAMVAMQISSDYEEAALQAQAVIARSNFYRLFFREKNLLEVLRKSSYGLNDLLYCWGIPWDVYEKAVVETEGQILVHEGKLKLVPYHEISSGMTRDGVEVFRDPAYSYLKSVDSSIDKESSEYLNSTYISIQQMPKTLNISERDSAGYVKSLLADEYYLEGEAFRQGMGLASSNFSMQKIGDEIRFLCKGKGHGLGFSQYGGNELANNKKTYQEILAVYFPEMELAYISDFH